jgi:DNA sulfur modification protein DndE
VIETVKVSSAAKDQLLTLKRRTGIKQWNTLCRWALLRSLAEPASPPHTEIVTDSNVEMSWKVFAGAHEDLIAALVRQRCAEDGLELSETVIATQFRLHLHRGIGYLVGDQRVRNIDGFLSVASA